MIVREVQDLLSEEQRKRHEFYEMIGEDDKAEFINGEVVFHSPVMKRHTDATKLLLILLNYHVVKKQLGYVGVEKVMVALTRNDYEPDLCYFNPEKAKHFKPKQLLYPVPDFVVEILSKSNQQNIDRYRITKFKDYEQHKVPEYWIVDPELKSVDQYILKNDRYELILKSKQGDIESQVVTGFSIPIAAIFDENIHTETLESMMLRYTSQ